MTLTVTCCHIWAAARLWCDPSACWLQTAPSQHPELDIRQPVASPFDAMRASKLGGSSSASRPPVGGPPGPSGGALPPSGPSAGMPVQQDKPNGGLRPLGSKVSYGSSNPAPSAPAPAAAGAVWGSMQEAQGNLARICLCSMISHHIQQTCWKRA